MAVIEGVGDEVTILFGLVFMVLVLVLAWASTRTVDRGDQELRPTEDTSAPTSEQQNSPCTSSTNRSPDQGETIANTRRVECKAEQMEQSEEEEQSEDEEEEEQDEEKEEQSKEVDMEQQSEEVEREQQSKEVERKQSEEVEREQQSDKVEGRQSEEVEKQEREKGNELEEELLAKHEPSTTEKVAEGLVTDNVPELDTSPLDTLELRQRVTSASGREELETLSTDDQRPDSDCAEDSSMVLRLKFLNDTERIARVRPEDTIGHIKRTHFPHQEHQIRLIYQGQLLGDDTRTLSSLHIVNNCVVHCHISQNATPQSPAGSHAAENTETTLNIGSLMLPVFFLMLSVLWYYQLNYRQFFTTPATISLVGITILFSFVAFGAYRR
ncbi:transmembrane and ubiquitin-like domain-containing protein 1 [Carcharodon carcharias]|uniref:transmembrane and ubiquitin-like domain-containing protein 1 n=1 Tax=Carcharodon carcharias TaxID=13397 RepID=UPI001B7F3761|nr:transmembrane and ubiquitin-like domain-containing protein 1 [Carcharodon carcharias]XP_041044988.1 transmembrane and ubiquitin-like domain-containing protein 1 [Carcharodon carcharias]XP_041044989.1 transmembrane and ubiquitin-like domain-containing protein 1 [Carcharodon carcharias]XP_041044990.1 transmembrane and ubiquitin-like domain-containing protein 1 [Carcharodon carcharias]XP_041044991.1 transmembrane and ubiquitin-like domain-containing protein 1 [Carcharodon carcharias]